MKGSFNIFERHVEKGVLGLCGAFLLYMLYGYVVTTPNKAPYDNQQVKPGELYDVVKSKADALEQRVRSASAEGQETPKYDEQLAKSHSVGIFSSTEGAPPLAKTLAITTDFGKQIQVPGLEEEQPAGSVALVKPLRPSRPKLVTGRSMVVARKLPVTPEPQAAVAAVEEEQVEEQNWVTVAAYFDKKAQFAEMSKANYAPYRSRVYLMGAEVERQEMRASGEWSDWKLVQSNAAQPQLEIADPIFDSETGDLVNKGEVDQAFRLVKAEQNTLVQPPFLYIEDGDSWDIPPLHGWEPEADDQPPDTGDEPVTAAPPTPTGPFGRPGAPSEGGRQAPPPVGGARGGRAGGGRSEGGGGRGGLTGSFNAGASAADQKREARRQIVAALKEARQLLRQKQWTAAREIGARVKQDPLTMRGHKKDADLIIRKADRELQKERGSITPFGQRPPVEQFITNPDNNSVATWYHDDTVEAGKTYRYRLRVQLWNRYVGQMRALADPEDAKQAVLRGDWSFPSDPITVTPSEYFFVKGGQESAASFEVWTWRKGSWLKRRFDAQVGDVIGEVAHNVRTGELDAVGGEVKADIDFETGAIVLDVRPSEKFMHRVAGKDGSFSYQEKQSAIVLYLDPADGQVKEKVALLDRYDPIQARLEEEEG